MMSSSVAAEAFARAWARWRRLRRTPSPAAWVLTVTSNASLDHVRRHHPPLRPPEVLHGPAELVVERLALAQAIGSLPRRQRAAVTLRYLADWSETDVANALGVSAGSVKTHLHRGLARLRELLSDSERIT